MHDELTIHYKPLGGSVGNAVERACYSDIGLSVGGKWLTTLEDRLASTVSDHIRGNVHLLATWFAANWWRLRWEPESRDWATDVDWRMAHSIASAGGGFVWPNVLFSSDGDTIAVASRPKLDAASFEPVRYLYRVDAHIPAVEFENKVDNFLESVITRLRELKIDDDSLPQLWAGVMAERRDPRAAQWRKLEAMAGYDPDEAPEGLSGKLHEDQDRLGKGAVEEVAAEARHGLDAALQPMREASRSRQPREGGCRVAVPPLKGKGPDAAAYPWQVASILANQARDEWGLGAKPIRNKGLADLLSTSSNNLFGAFVPRAKTPFAIRNGRNGHLDVYLHSPIPASRRFALCRLIGDQLLSNDKERLVPATHARTVRQKFQRAFAQEFLCPYPALRERLQTDKATEDDIIEAAQYFHVSPLLVKTTLVNKGEMERAALPADSGYARARE